jgi:hypothetical protein
LAAAGRLGYRLGVALITLVHPLSAPSA